MYGTALHFYFILKIHSNQKQKLATKCSTTRENNITMDQRSLSASHNGAYSYAALGYTFVI